MNKYLTLYNILLENGDLFEIFEGMTGTWKEDKEKFTQNQKDLESQTITNLEINDFEEYID